MSEHPVPHSWNSSKIYSRFTIFGIKYKLLMVFGVLFLISLIQLACYFLKKKLLSQRSQQGSRYFPDFIILLIVILLYNFIIPPFFYPNQEHKVACGLPILGIHFGFLLYGSIAAILTHVIGRHLLSTSATQQHSK